MDILLSHLQLRLRERDPDLGQYVLLNERDQVMVQLCQQHLRKPDRPLRWGDERLLLIGDGNNPPLAEIAKRLRLTVASHE